MQKDTKNFMIDGKNMQFDSVSFKALFTSGRKKAGMSVLEYETELGEALSVSSNAIHNWRFGMNGPSDLYLRLYATSKRWKGKYDNADQ